MEYKIVKFDATQGKITVKCQELYFNVDLPVTNGLFPVGEELDNLITGFIPVWHFERLAALASGVTNADAIQALVEEEPEVVSELQPQQYTSGTQTV